MHSESGDDDELVRERWDDSDRHSPSTSWWSSVGGLF